MPDVNRVITDQRAALAALPDFVDADVAEVDLPPYFQRDGSDMTLFDVDVAVLSDKNTTLACVQRAHQLNFTCQGALSAAQPGAQHDCACLFAIAAIMSHNASVANESAPGESLYSLPAKAFIMSATVFVSLTTVFGNAVVLTSFVIERGLRQATNYFIASLAVTDLLIGLFSMNFFSLYLILDYHWPLGNIVCDLWLALDFTVCLASQYTVFFITIDRFCSVKLPAKYRNWRTDQKVLWMVLGCWILPTAVFFPIILGWPYFKQRQRQEHQCEAEFIWDPWLTLWLTIGYYWITLVAMTTLYVVIYRVAVQMNKKANANRKRVSAVFQLAEKSVVRLQVCMTQSLTVPDSQTKQEVRHSISINSAAPGSSASRSSRCGSLFEDSDNENTQEEDNHDRSAINRAIRDAANRQLHTINAMHSSAKPTRGSQRSKGQNSSVRDKKARFDGSQAQDSSKSSACRVPSREADTERDSGTVQSPSDARRDKGRMSTKASRFQALAQRVSAISKRSDTGQQNKKAENRARKALRTITFILGCFVACWTPYHIVILIDSFAKLWFGEPIVNAHVYNFSYWLCYLNSPINPFCYAFVNAQFKKTFLRILKFDWSIK